MVVTDWTGTEIANGTDLSAISAHPYRAVLSAAQTPSVQSRLSGGGRILDVQIELPSAFTGGQTNFWVVTAFLRRLDSARPQPVGEKLGSFSTEYRSIAAQTPVSLYSDGRGTVFHESDRLVVSAAATGTPLPMVGAMAWARIARGVT